MISRTIREWERIRYGSGEHEIPAWAADRIAAVARASPLAGPDGNGVLVHGRSDLRAGQVVGVIVADDCSLEVLPKINDAGIGEVRQRLVHMLGVAYDLDVVAGDLTSLDWQREDLLEILIRLFTDRLLEAVRRGLPRSYIEREDDLLALRGRLVPIRQFTTLLSSPQVIACRYDALSSDITLNHIMKAAVRLLSHLTRVERTQRALRELTFVYADVTDVPAASLDLAAVTLDRTNSRWRDLLELARLFLNRRFQTTSGGGGSGFALLFPMNDLFENYIARLLSRAVRPEGMTVVAQGGRLHCLTDLETRAPRFQTKPDLLIKNHGEICLVADTKWKRLMNYADDPKQGVSQTDIYQMMAYGRLYACPRLALIYPHHSGLDGPEGVVRRHRVVGCADEIAVITYDLSRADQAAIRLRGAIHATLAAPAASACSA